jgi:hypothetical protein
MEKGTARSADVARETIRAAEGERVWVLLNHVKGDEWEQHKDFVHNVLMPAAEKADPTAFRHSRFLHPAEQNEDGTYTSVFLMDPVIEGADYEILSLLRKVYGDEKAEEYIKLWSESLASPQAGYELIQAL